MGSTYFLPVKKLVGFSQLSNFYVDDFDFAHFPGSHSLMDDNRCQSIKQIYQQGKQIRSLVIKKKNRVLSILPLKFELKWLGIGDTFASAALPIGSKFFGSGTRS